ncbi:MAG: radical SAM protein [Planctomycetes bacterium]|nr:radical SAM protein [Planctomycetota bacterium]
MRIQTFSILAGSAACNARCPFCVSRMTPAQGMGRKPAEPHWRNLRKACLLAQQAGVSTAMLTGKGEPTLFPDQVTAYLQALEPFRFPFIELQTNGIPIADGDIDDGLLRRWYDLGLSTVIVSVVDTEAESNRLVYLPHRERYIDLPALVARLHAIGFSVRLGGIALRDRLDHPAALQRLLAFGREHRVEQLTLRPVTTPDPATVQDQEVFAWTRAHAVPDERWQALAAWVREHGRLLMHLVHGAAVFDLDGQNLCLSNCLTVRPDGSDLRQLIFFPDGHLRYDWQYEGAILL